MSATDDSSFTLDTSEVQGDPSGLNLSSSLLGYCSGLSAADLQLLQEGRVSHEISKIGVWKADEISPASYLYSHKAANSMIQWNPRATSRILNHETSGDEVEVIVHEDSTALHLRESGRFITHFRANSLADSARIRSFTNETIPFTVYS